MSSSSPGPGKIALFGGTFDPVHDGHLAIARAAVAQASLAEVIFLPARISPHKTDRITGAGPADRLAMLQLATADLAWARVSSWEIDEAPPSFTWKTVLHFREIAPDVSLCWILGADQWEVIETWARPDLLREHLEFLVFPRAPYPHPADRAGWRSRVLEVEHPGSATEIRAALAAGVARPPHLPAAVARFVAEKLLYGPDRDAL